jgi:hypothetical protein
LLVAVQIIYFLGSALYCQYQHLNLPGHNNPLEHCLLQEELQEELQGELQEEIQHEGIKTLVDTYSKKIENELAENQMAQQEKEREKETH